MTLECSHLDAFGQTASGKQFAGEFLTSRGGTEISYIARAFRRGFRERLLIQQPESHFLSLPSLAIAGDVLREGAGHFIVIVSQTAVTIGDPVRGKLVVKKADLKNYYHFTGFFLVVQP